MEKGDYRNYIRIRGASEHNLKNIDVDIPRDSLVLPLILYMQKAREDIWSHYLHMQGSF